MPENEYIDTQGMTGGKITGEVPTKPVKHSPMPVKKTTVLTDMERKELKELINEVLDEREERFHRESNEWLYRGTY